MPAIHVLPGTPADRARFHAAIAEIHARGEELRDGFHQQREEHVRTAASLAVERRILREDFTHWNDEGAQPPHGC